MEMENQRNRLKLATFNIRLDTIDDGPENGPYRWVYRSQLVKKTIESYQWDVLGFQEVQEKQLKDLLEMKDYDYVGKKRDNSDVDEYNPIFYKSTKFELVDTTTFWLSETPETPSLAREWNASNPRICTVAHLLNIETSKEFIVINTHFDHISELARYNSAALVMDRIKTISKDIPLFFIGDFNGSVDERWYKEVNSQLQDSVSKSPHHVGPFVTCTGVAFSYLPSWDDMQYIDFVFTNNKVEVLKTAIVTDKFQQYYPSDHFPVSLECNLV